MRHLDIAATYLFCLAGLLGYVLGAPLVALVRAGTPPHEWLFYLDLALLGVVAPALAGRRAKGSRLGATVGLAVSLGTLLLGGYVGAVFTGTPLCSLALLGYGLVLFSLYATLVLIARFRSTTNWLNGPTDRWLLVVLTGLAILGAASWSGFGHQQRLTPPNQTLKLSFWGAWDATRLPDQVLSDLQAIDATVYVFGGEKLLEPETRDKFHQAMARYTEYDVEVMVASILPSHGGFVSAANYGPYIRHTRQLLTFVEAQNIAAVVGVIADVEPPHNVVDPNVPERPQEWIFKENSRYRRWSVGRYERALAAYSEQVRSLTPDWHVMISTLPMAVYDDLDGDPDLSIAYQFVAYPPRSWDGFNVQVYSSHQPRRAAPYTTWQGVRLSQHIVEGVPLSVSLGIVGEGSMGGEAGFQRLVEDVNICRGLGVGEVIVFSLKWGVEAYGPGLVSRLAEAAPAPVDVRFSRLGGLVAYGACLWDAVLDLRGAKGLFVLAWCVIVVSLRLWSIR